MMPAQVSLSNAKASIILTSWAVIITEHRLCYYMNNCICCNLKRMID